MHSPFRSMPEFNDGEFDAVLDKGTFDALLCGEDAFVNRCAAAVPLHWSVITFIELKRKPSLHPQQPYSNSTAMLEECRRVLKPGGCMMIITVRVRGKERQFR